MRGLQKWFVLIALGTAMFVLGLWGLRIMKPGGEFADYTIYDEFHSVARLFLLEDIFPPGDKPWQAELARFLAPIPCSIGAIASVMAASSRTVRIGSTPKSPTGANRPSCCG